ncbi:MAG: bifunctional adenosylcobinamide kinase/adenosylcobinamide-phosphate guanylyltransferase [Sphaerochaetaceae bacterium]
MATMDIKRIGITHRSVKPSVNTVQSATSGEHIRSKSKSKVSLVIGGERSGKSTYAQDYALEFTEEKESRYFIATAQAMDDEMKARIAAHQESRKGRFITIEEPIELGRALTGLPPSCEVCVVDCLTVWLGNLMYHKKLDGRLEALLEALRNPSCDIVLVTNETGLGVIPADKESREYVDIAGRLNQEVASLASNVIVMICGIPTAIKGRLL